MNFVEKTTDLEYHTALDEIVKRHSAPPLSVKLPDQYFVEFVWQSVTYRKKMAKCTPNIHIIKQFQLIVKKMCEYLVDKVMTAVRAGNWTTSTNFPTYQPFFPGMNRKHGLFIGLEGKGTFLWTCVGLLIGAININT